MIIISVVSGTYNRLKYLTQMVASVRLSVGVGIPYEIIIVDGGSTDGTIQWCRMQDDIVLIEQGKLLGAVKAFNAGFAIARGKYTIPANDDILFVNESIRCAIAFMEDNPSCGIGCFYQNRYGKDWHVENMSVVSAGKNVPMPYGQVCIIPTWLGTKVGWWGDIYHTYAGDNEMSCNVYELGYTIKPVPCACIEDYVADDELRRINKGDPKHFKGGIHPDSKLYVAKWTHEDGTLGPILPNHIMARQDKRQPRILYAPIYEQWSTIQHKTKRGLRDAFVKAGWIIDEVDYFKCPDYIFDAANAIKPDVILMQLHDAKTFNASKVAELRSEHPRAKLVSWNGDYFPEHFLSVDYMRLMKMLDLATFVTTDVNPAYDIFGIHWKYWQIGYETPLYGIEKQPQRYDVVFLGNAHYHFRNRLGEVLRGLHDVKVGLFGRWPAKYRPDGENLYDYDAGHKLYQQAKITISDGRPGPDGMKQSRWVSNRLYQAMHAGCFVFQQWFEGIDELLGFIDGVHYVTYKSTEDLPEMINHWLGRDEERNAIAAAGKAKCESCDNFDVRVAQFTAMIEELDLVTAM